MLTSFSLFRLPGKVVLLLLFLTGASAGAYLFKERVGPHLRQERENMEAVGGAPRGGARPGGVTVRPRDPRLTRARRVDPLRRVAGHRDNRVLVEDIGE